ncbi:WecB/TagA/CpsF family glycosyltransferase [Chlorogloeopsis sp. ULAP02]|uniref:WecB/TagA/CpsF family glycosyltransferase n=1 Tax=Chlorogloeopsis sp. ULAP02 TaxID=3107926 RepID=UPI0031368C62
MLKKVTILNIRIDSLSTIDLLKKLDFTGGVVFTPNVDHLMKLQVDQDFYQVYQQADYCICDGQFVMLASKFLGNSIQEKISGSDFLSVFYSYHALNPNIKIFLLGGVKGVAQKAQEIINNKVGRKIVSGSYSPPFNFEKSEQECFKIVELINKSEATVLVVGLGAPKQEKWILKYKKYLSYIKIFLAVGAAIDFEAGYKKRAPKWLRNLWLETPYRLLCEPRRLWRRYLLDDPPFFWLILKQKLNLYKNPFAVSNKL